MIVSTPSQANRVSLPHTHPEALAFAVQAGLDWCRDNGPELPLSLEVGLLPPATFSAAEVEPYLLEGIEAMRRDGGVVQLTSAAPDRFRTLAVEPRTGRVALIEGGAAVKDDWQSTVRRLTEEMRALAPVTVYGFLKRGSRLKDAILGISLPSDWLDVPHMNALLSPRWAVEDRLVPDAFGVQLLSVGHGEHIANGQDWRIEQLGSGRVLVGHVDPAAWFDGSLVRFGGHPNPYYKPLPTPARVPHWRAGGFRPDSLQGWATASVRRRLGRPTLSRAIAESPGRAFGNDA